MWLNINMLEKVLYSSAQSFCKVRKGLEIITLRSLVILCGLCG